MKKTILMSIVVFAISVAIVSVGTAQQKPAGMEKPVGAQIFAALQKFAMAQPASGKENWEKVRGEIIDVNKAPKEITVQTSKEKMVFSVSEKTKISEVSTKRPLSDLKEGMPVTVEYRKEGNKALAEWIEVTRNVVAHAVTPALAKEGKSEKIYEKK